MFEIGVVEGDGAMALGVSFYSGILFFVGMTFVLDMSNLLQSFRYLTGSLTRPPPGHSYTIHHDHPSTAPSPSPSTEDAHSPEEEDIPDITEVPPDPNDGLLEPEDLAPPSDQIIPDIEIQTFGEDIP